MNQSIPKSAAKKPRPRRFQYSLRTLMIVMFLASIGMSWYATWRRIAGKQREAVAALRGVGAVVSYDYQDFGLDPGPDRSPPGPAWRRIMFGVDSVSNVVAIEFVDRRLPIVLSVSTKDLKPVSELKGLTYYAPPLCVTDAGLTYVRGLNALRHLDLANCKQITDAGMEHLTELRDLEYLELDSTAISDAGLSHLKELKRLRHIRLENTRITDKGLLHLSGLTGIEDLLPDSTHVTDEGLAHLSKLAGLRELFLDSTPVKGDGLVHLAPLANLEELRLNDTNVDDASLTGLQHMTGLKNLWLNGTRVTDAGIDHLLALTKLEFATFMDTAVTEKGVGKLQQAIPTCRVQIGQLLGPRPMKSYAEKPSSSGR
jgi:hypothetical protein